MGESSVRLSSQKMRGPYIPIYQPSPCLYGNIWLSLQCYMVHIRWGHPGSGIHRHAIYISLPI